MCHSHISILAVIVPFYRYAFNETTQGDPLLECPTKHNGGKPFMELLYLAAQLGFQTVTGIKILLGCPPYDFANSQSVILHFHEFFNHSE